jgi:hypothetical protein
MATPVNFRQIQLIFVVFAHHASQQIIEQILKNNASTSREHSGESAS